MRIELIEEVPSTNEYIRRYLSGGENIAVCAERQTGGKGTKGRSFSSERGGVYLSALFFYEHFPAREAFRVMMRAAVSVCRTIEHFSLIPEIKWPNDVLVEDRKACGILIENFLEGDEIKASIVGIGLNVQNDVSSLGGIAFALSEKLPRLSAEEVRGELLRHMEEDVSFSDYGKYIRTGNSVTVDENGTQYTAVVKGVCEDGRLEIFDGVRTKRLSAAEIGRIK